MKLRQLLNRNNPSLISIASPPASTKKPSILSKASPLQLIQTATLGDVITDETQPDGRASQLTFKQLQEDQMLLLNSKLEEKNTKMSEFMV